MKSYNITPTEYWSCKKCQKEIIVFFEFDRRKFCSEQCVFIFVENILEGYEDKEIKIICYSKQPSIFGGIKFTRSSWIYQLKKMIVEENKTW